MGNTGIFIDFGSTFTKMVAFDLDAEELIAGVQVPSTVDSDITIGLDQAFSLLAEDIGIGNAEREQAVACSSAAGGLRVICVGLVSEFTTEAARIAALGAGAKIVGVYSFELSDREIAEIEEIRPDIVLLTGGTDGGNKKVICHNAKALASTGPRVKNIVIAGNKSAYDAIRDIFAGTAKNLIFAKNVMPEIGVLDIESSNRTIREIFLRHITDAKGIAKVKSKIRDVIMPTPSAVLAAAKLMADGVSGTEGFGELILVDVGGATTDVYSVADGLPTRTGVNQVGLPEPYAKRTVEGDLGLVYNLATLQEISKSTSATANFGEFASSSSEIGRVPVGEKQQQIHIWLSHLAVKTAVERHVGRIEARVFPNGEMYAQRGKDLGNVKWVVGSGGPIVFSREPRLVLAGALSQDGSPGLLKPKTAELMIDKNYIMFALGLLAQSDPIKAMNLIKKYVVKL